MTWTEAFQLLDYSMRQLLVCTCVLRVQLLPPLGKTNYRSSRSLLCFIHMYIASCLLLAFVSINQLGLALVFHECTSMSSCIAIVLVKLFMLLTLGVCTRVTVVVWLCAMCKAHRGFCEIHSLYYALMYVGSLPPLHSNS